MKIEQSIWRWTMPLSILFLLILFNGCGSVQEEAKGGDGSSTTAVGGATVVGTNTTINVTTNRRQIKVGDNALITVTVSCSQAGAGGCILNSAGQLVFAALPTEFQTGDGAPQAALVITSNYSVTAPATLSVTTDSFTLAAGIRADSTATPPKPVIPGSTAISIVFTVTLTGVNPGSAIFTAQSLNTIATLVIDVVGNATSVINP
ncbi:MAG: hypothetical protein ACE5GQ_02940 [Nitrospinales bacterium]